MCKKEARHPVSIWPTDNTDISTWFPRNDQKAASSQTHAIRNFAIAVVENTKHTSPTVLSSSQENNRNEQEIYFPPNTCPTKNGTVGASPSDWVEAFK